MQTTNLSINFMQTMGRTLISRLKIYLTIYGFQGCVLRHNYVYTIALIIFLVVTSKCFIIFPQQFITYPQCIFPMRIGMDCSFCEYSRKTTLLHIFFFCGGGGSIYWLLKYFQQTTPIKVTGMHSAMRVTINCAQNPPSWITTTSPHECRQTLQIMTPQKNKD